jgi:hypothetical protein
MTVRIESLSTAKVTEIYRANRSRRFKSGLDARGALGGDFLGKSDSVHFSPEALEKARLLKESEEQEAERSLQFQREQDAKLRRSLSVLDLNANADIEEIRSAFHYLIKSYHPDKYIHLPPEFREMAETKSREIIQAYKTLMDKHSAE